MRPLPLPRDITRCHGRDCPARNDCARFTSRPENVVLSWATTLNPDGDPGDCLFFIPITD